MIGDPDEGEPPEVFIAGGARYVPRAAQEDGQGDRRQLDQHGRARARRRARRTARRGARSRRARLVEAHATPALQPNLAALQAGIDAAAGIDDSPRLAAPAPARRTRWLISGNEAAGYGAIRGGVRFVAAYPITPATELLEWMAPALTKVGGTLLQAEDELASINMIIGASYGGVPVAHRDRRPGLALMTEGIGLAVSAEVPIVVVDVMRGGPSTGIPAKSEQSDLVVRGQRPARRRAAAGARADLDRRLPRHDAMGGAARRGAAGAGDRAVRPVHGPVARDHRPARATPASSPQRLTAAAEHARLQALSRHRNRASRRWRSPARPASSTPPTGSSTPKPGFRAARRATTRCSSTSASASCCGTTTASGGPTSRATATPR